MFLSKEGLYRQVYSDENLSAAWRKVRTNSHVAGVDGITLEEFERNLFANLKAIQSLLQAKRYYPQPAKRFHLSKTDGSRPPFGILSFRDRLIQRAVLQVIQPIFDRGFEECSFSFRPGRSAQMALDHAVRLADLGYLWGVEPAIDSCFERVDVARLFELIRAKIRERELRRMLKAWLDIGVVGTERRGLFRRQVALGILPGAVLSPLLLNTYLDQFDKRALAQGLKPVRYSDNILLLSRTEAEAQKGLKTAGKILAGLDLSINPHKTQITHLEKGVRFLGRTLCWQKVAGKAYLKPAEGKRVPFRQLPRALPPYELSRVEGSDD